MEEGHYVHDNAFVMDVTQPLHAYLGLILNLHKAQHSAASFGGPLSFHIHAKLTWTLSHVRDERTL
jgi:hypothetical protein